jgi:formiminotetrahydrofolate cyclodeaminase
MTIGELLGSVAARSPVPGGGATAGLTAALAAALGQMVVEYSAGKAPSPEAEDLHEEALGALPRLRASALELADADAEAFARLSALWKLSPDHARRRAEWTDAVAAAIDAPQRVMETARETLHLLRRLLGNTKDNLRSDLAIAALLAEAAGRAAAWNVRINLPLLEDPAETEQIDGETTSVLEEARSICEAIEQACLTPTAAR